MTKEEIEDLSLVDCSSSEIELVHKAVNYIEELETQLKKQQEINQKAIEYIKNKGGYCEEYDMTSKPFNTIELDDLLQILEDKEV